MLGARFLYACLLTIMATGLSVVLQKLSGLKATGAYGIRVPGPVIRTLNWDWAGCRVRLARHQTSLVSLPPAPWSMRLEL